ncbi:MAG: hypothetical protein HY736_20230 [Verrucomicrobia bacterium]|nr:hypothetical protein [Verrucomicrobiota bacterium]
MKFVRILLFAVAGVVAVLLLAVAVAFNSTFQTWAVRKALASKPGIHVSVGLVSAGWKHVALRTVWAEQAGAVLTLPAVEVDLPLLAAGRGQKVLVSRLVAKGWTLDLSKQIAPPKPRAGQGTALPPATRRAPSPPELQAASTAGSDPNAAGRAVVQAFAGVFAQLRLPVDVSIDAVELDGEVILPAAQGRAKILLQGGGLGVGRQGKFDLAGDATLTDPAVNAVAVHGTLMVAMDTPRTFTRIAARLDASASGAQFPNGVKLTADLSATRGASGESYSAAVVARERQLLTVKADFPAGARRLDGTWKLDASDADVAPFALGRPLPAFAAAGEGRFDADAAFTAVHATGRLNATVDRLSAIQAGLSAIGAIRLDVDFDLAQRGDLVVVEKLALVVAAAQPIATVQSLQAFEFSPKSGELKAADPRRELLGIAMQGLPLAWASPFSKDIVVSGGDVRGEFVATASGGGVTVRSKTPLAAAGVSVSQSGKPLLSGVDFSVNVSGDLTPQGWQAELAGLTAKSGGVVFLALDAKAGQLAGTDQPLTATGRLSAHMPGLLAQPTANHALGLTNGEATVEFIARLATRKEVQAKITLVNLIADPKTGAEKLPAISADLRADIAANGQIALNAPLVLERGGRKTDLTLAGTITPGKDGLTLDAQVSSSQFVVDDAKVLAAMLPGSPGPESAAPETAGRKPVREVAPAWAGLSGSLAVRLKKVIYSDTFQATDVAGTLRLDGSSMKLEGVRAGLGEGSEAKLKGAVTFDQAAPQPYALDADLTVTEFDPAPLFRAMNPGQPATVEGRFNVSSRLSSRAATIGDLALGADGNFQLTSKEGTFRGLPVSVASKLETTSGLAAGIARLGNLANAISGKNDKTIESIANRAQVVSELVNYWKAIPYDQLSVTISRDAALNTTLKDFTLISPEVRLSGGGHATHRAGAALLDDALAMEFKLGARGRHGELLKYLGVLAAQPDELGYAACTLPLRISGTLGKPDTSELNHKLAAIALEKSGVTDKAADLFNKLLGGGK